MNTLLGLVETYYLFNSSIILNLDIASSTSSFSLSLCSALDRSVAVTMPSNLPSSITGNLLMPFLYMTFATAATVASGPTLINGSDIISPTLVADGLLSSAIRRLTMSLSVIIPIGFPESTTTRQPLALSFITLAARDVVNPRSIVSIGDSVIISVTLLFNMSL